MMEQEIEVNEQTNGLLVLNRADIQRMSDRRQILKEFIGSQLREGILNDFAVIPGTKKKSLLKPGAEKLLRLFNCGIRVRLSDKVIDLKENFSIFIYRAEVYNLTNGQVIAECEGSANSQEDKYKERFKWVDGKNGNRQKMKEVTPIGDLMNTLMKMAQKRAIVGASILAFGASDFFSQDIEDERDLRNIGQKTARPPKQEVSNFGDYEVPFGDKKGMKISDLSQEDIEKVVDWYVKMKDEPKGIAKDFLNALEGFLGQSIR